MWDVAWGDSSVASVSQDHSLRLWDPRSGECVALHNEPLALRGVTFVGDNLVVSSTAELKRFDPRNLGTPTHVIPRRHVTALAVKEDRLAVAGDDGRVAVMRTDLTEVRELSRHSDFARAIGWHPQDQQLVTGGWDSTLVTHTL